jgi:hypothetical protein
MLKKKLRRYDVKVMNLWLVGLIVISALLFLFYLFGIALKCEFSESCFNCLTNTDSPYLFVVFVLIWAAYLYAWFEYIRIDSDGGKFIEFVSSFFFLFI